MQFFSNYFSLSNVYINIFIKVIFRYFCFKNFYFLPTNQNINFFQTYSVINYFLQNLKDYYIFRSSIYALLLHLSRHLFLQTPMTSRTFLFNKQLETNKQQTGWDSNFNFTKSLFFYFNFKIYRFTNI